MAAAAALLRADPRVAASLDLHNAASHGHVEALRRLLAAGAPADATDKVCGSQDVVLRR